MGLFLKWDITYRCNLMCGHCVNGGYLDNHSDDISYEGVVGVVEEIQQHIPIDRIHFLGGEPLVRKDFVDIATYLDKQGIYFGFNTNGLLLKPDFLDKIGELAHFETVVISLEGPNAQINDAIRGKNVFHVILDRIRLIKKFKEEHPNAKFRLTVNTVVTSQNYDKITDVLELCEKERVDCVNLLEFIEEGNGVGKRLSLTNQQLLDTIADVAAYYTSHDKTMQITPKFVRPVAADYARKCLSLDFPEVSHTCGAGASMLYLDNKGYVYPCDRQRNFSEKKGELFKETFWDIWDSDFFREPFAKYMSDDLYQLTEPCKDCQYLKENCFPCYLYLDANTNKEMTLCSLLRQKISEVSSDDL